MAFPLKSGADLYNNQLIRAAIWNYSADIIEPSELVTGLIYFNTSNSSAGKKLRLYTGSAWKTIAFEEDLDVANNAEFKALEDKVKLLSGEVDTDAIINNMKDVENFLAGFNESGGTLMNYLNTELGKKLNKTGGTIGDYTNVPLTINCITANSWAGIRYQSNSITLGGIGVDNGTPIFVNKEWNNTYPILHSGNVGEYNAGGLVTIDSRNKNYAPYANDFTKKALTSHFERALSIGYGATDYYVSMLHISPWSGDSGGPEHQLAFRADGAIGYRHGQTAWSDWKTIAFTDSTVEAARKLMTDNGGNLVHFASNTLYVGDTIYPNYQTHILGYEVVLRSGASATHGLILNSSGNVTIGGSDLAGTSAKLYVGGRAVATDGFYVADSSDSYEAVQLNPAYGLYIGYGTSDKYSTLLWGQNIKFVTGTNGQTRLYIANGGNVLIGTTEDNGAKLQVNGNMTLEYNKIGFGGNVDIYHIGWGGSNMFSYNNYYGHYFSTNGGTERLRITQGGYVGIGLTDPKHKLHVGGDIVANGTIACKGIAAEGDAMDMVDKVVLHIVPNGNQQTFTLTHGLGTREITICIYEVTSLGTNMILTDVEIVNDNSISVSFGNPPTDNHMVVVMG